MSSSVSDFFRREIPHTLDWVGRTRLTAGVVICFAIFWWMACAIGLPPAPEQGGSLLSQPAQSVAMGAVAGTLIVCTIVARFIVGNLQIGDDLQSEGALLAALLGMTAVVYRLGSVRYAYFSLDDPKAFFFLAVELALIYVIVGFCWLALQWAGPTAKGAGAAQPELLGNKVAALLTHVVVMTTCMLFLCQSEATGQALMAVGLSALVGSMAAHLVFPVRCSAWYWISPAIVGVIGYAAAYFSPAGLAIGFPSGAMGALARAGPLAYASAGPAGAILGYWMVYRWQGEQAGS